MTPSKMESGVLILIVALTLAHHFNWLPDLYYFLILAVLAWPYAVYAFRTPHLRKPLWLGRSFGVFWFVVAIVVTGLLAIQVQHLQDAPIP